jgi:hypothetical protein
MSKINVKEELEKIDDTLSTLGEAWIDSKEEKKSMWFAKINKALDGRIKIMKIRDEK